VIGLCNRAQDPNSLLCSDARSLSKEDLLVAERLNETLLEDAYAFASSFIKNRPKSAEGDVTMSEESK
jgi:hypothetical protein